MKTYIAFVACLLILVGAAGCADVGVPGDLDIEAAARTATPTATALPTSGAPVPADTPELPPTFTPEPTAARLLVWVRQEPAVINPEKQPLGWDYGADQRRKNSFVAWEVNENSFASRQRYQEDENIWYDNVVVRVTFERPPIVLNPELRYALGAAFSHSSGALNVGYEGLGETFLWHVTKGSIDPPAAFTYLPYASNFDGTAEKEWMLSIPPPARPGEELVLSASMMNWPPGRVVWTYKAEYH